jgi:UDP-N-acetylglucosamine enolpyruvyl transferase
MDIVSVGATENILMAATLAKGTTLIENDVTRKNCVNDWK